MNELHFSDNLDVLREMRSATIDFIYLDPPFNSNAAYNVLYGTKRGGPSQAQPNRAIVSVKGGLNVGVDAVHKLKSVMLREKAEMGVLVCINPPTKAMMHEAVSAGEIGPKSRQVARIQIVTTDQLFHKHPVDYPGMIDPPDILRAVPSSAARPKRKRDMAQTEMLFPLVNDEQRTADKAASGEAAKAKGNRSIRTTNIEVTRALPLKRNAG